MAEPQTPAAPPPASPRPGAPPPAKPTIAGWVADQLRTESLRERRLPHVMLAAIALFVVSFVAWAIFFQIEEVARGEGRVITRSQTQVITNLEGGIIAEILVREGDHVKKGDPLVRIDPTRFESALKEGEASSLALKAKVARLTAETGHTAFAMPADVSKGSPTIAPQETALYKARQAEIAGKTQIARQQLAQRESELKELKSRSERLAEQLKLVDQELFITAPLVKKGVVSEVELLRLEREQTRTRQDLEQAQLSVPRAVAAIDEARGRLADTEASFRSQAGADLAVAQGELSKVAEQMPALEDRATRTIVRAGMDGIVKTIANKTIGGVVQPGSPMIEMVPEEDTLLIETRVKPTDIAFLRVGQRAVVKISAYDYSIFGGLEGKGEYISAGPAVPG